jgi:hypothetical protein
MYTAQKRFLITWAILNMLIYGILLTPYVIWDFFVKPKYQIGKRHFAYIKKLIDKI